MSDTEIFFVYITSGDAFYSFPCENVKEILPYPVLATKNSASSSILGMFDYQNTSLPLIDFSCLAHLPYDPPSIVIILEIENTLFGLAVPPFIEISSQKKEAQVLDFHALLQQLPTHPHFAEVPPPPVTYVSLTILKEGNSLIALRSEMIEQIDDLGTFTSFPLQKTRCLGFKNIKGQILPLMQLKKGSFSSFSSAKLVIISEENERFGLVVEEIMDVLSIPSSLLTEDPPLFKMQQQEIKIVRPSFSDLSQSI